MARAVARVKIKCIQCAVTFEVIPSLVRNRKYSTRQCGDLSRIGKTWKWGESARRKRLEEDRGFDDEAKPLSPSINVTQLLQRGRSFVFDIDECQYWLSFFQTLLEPRCGVHITHDGTVTISSQ